MTEKPPLLDQVNLVVKDMAASVAFYERLGVEFDDGLPEWAPHHRTARMPGGDRPRPR
jgi:catechol 2,3-dioxygenase-like lactoylglutathione lyase family enzyme